MRTQNASKVFTKLIIGGLIGLSGHAMAQVKGAPTANKPTAPSATKADSVDISDIENKYWAPKDTDFNVVQNRTYPKEKRFSLSAQFGPAISESLNEGTATALSANYFFNERWGIQASYSMFDLKDNSATKAFIGAGGGPDYGRISNYYDIGLNWVPIYAKMSLLGKKIIYFDMAFTPVIGMVNYKSQFKNLPDKSSSSMSYGFDVTQLFFVHKNLAIRVDLKHRFYREDIYKYYTFGGIEGTKLRTKDSDSTTLLFGAALFF